MVIDIIFVLAVVYGFYVGYSRGIIKTVFTILSYVIGLIAAFKFAPSATRLLESTFDSNNPLMFIAGFLLAFVGTMLLIRLFAKGLETILETVNVNFVNQVAGGVLMAAVMVLIYSLILWFGDKSNIVSDETKQESFTYDYLEKYPNIVWRSTRQLQPIFVDFWDHTVNFMDRLQGSTVQEPTTGEAEDTTSYEIYDIEE
jgi:membrane protein required for colicin V production